VNRYDVTGFRPRSSSLVCTYTVLSRRGRIEYAHRSRRVRHDNAIAALPNDELEHRPLGLNLPARLLRLPIKPSVFDGSRGSRRNLFSEVHIRLSIPPSALGID